MLGSLRGLALGLTLSVLNLAGAFLTLLALGGLGAWTGTQFIGLFGLLEVATGAAFVVGPNVWRLPVAAAELEPGTRVRFAASTILIPHWAGGMKSIAGFALVGWAAAHEGVALGTAGAILIVVSVCAISIAVSMLFARIGCARPNLDVFQISIKRPGHKAIELPGMSIGASFVQTLLNIMTFPTIKLMSPSSLYSPELSPSPKLLAVLGLVALVMTAAAFAVWSDRLAWRATRPQQREAEDAFSEA
ncbi:MAG: hypothetical protein ABI939_06165 [Anaerolineaceae bacterium]